MDVFSAEEKIKDVYGESFKSSLRRKIRFLNRIVPDSKDIPPSYHLPEGIGVEHLQRDIKDSTTTFVTRAAVQFAPSFRGLQSHWHVSDNQI